MAVAAERVAGRILIPRSAEIPLSSQIQREGRLIHLPPYYDIEKTSNDANHTEMLSGLQYQDTCRLQVIIWELKRQEELAKQGVEESAFYFGTNIQDNYFKARLGHIGRSDAIRFVTIREGGKRKILPTDLFEFQYKDKATISRKLKGFRDFLDELAWNPRLLTDLFARFSIEAAPSEIDIPFYADVTVHFLSQSQRGNNVDLKNLPPFKLNFIQVPAT